MKKIMFCSILIMSMLCSCSDQSSSVSQSGIQSQTEKSTNKSDNKEYKEIDIFENVEVVNCLDFKYTTLIDYVEGERYNLYPIYGFIDAAQNPYFREYWRECYPDDNDEEINKCLENLCVYHVDKEKSSVTAEEQIIHVDFLLDCDSAISDLDDDQFHEFLENHHYKIKSTSKEYIVKPEEYDSEILNEEMYTNQIAMAVDDIIGNEISNDENLSNYQVYQKYLLLPTESFGFQNNINAGGYGYDVDNYKFSRLEMDCQLGMSIILKDNNSETYVMMRIMMVVNKEQIIDKLVKYSGEYKSDKFVTKYYSSLDECNEHIYDWSTQTIIKAVPVSK